MRNLTGYIYCQRNYFDAKKISTYLATLIRFFAKVKYNHVGVIITEDGEHWLYESVQRGVTKTLLSDKIKNKTYINDYLVLKPSYPTFKCKTVKERVHSILGVKYDVLTLIAVQLLWTTLNIWIGSKTEQKALKRMICYEVIWYAHKDCKLFQPNWWKSKPNNIYNSKQFKPLKSFEI